MIANDVMLQFLGIIIILCLIVLFTLEAFKEKTLIYFPGQRRKKATPAQIFVAIVLVIAILGIGGILL